jgi:hypothetical protein
MANGERASDRAFIFRLERELEFDLDLELELELELGLGFQMSLSWARAGQSQRPGGREQRSVPEQASAGRADRAQSKQTLGEKFCCVDRIILPSSPVRRQRVVKPRFVVVLFYLKGWQDLKSRRGAAFFLACFSRLFQDLVQNCATKSALVSDREGSWAVSTSG